MTSVPLSCECVLLLHAFEGTRLNPAFVSVQTAYAAGPSESNHFIHFLLFFSEDGAGEAPTSLGSYCCSAAPAVAPGVAALS